MTEEETRVACCMRRSDISGLEELAVKTTSTGQEER